MFDDQLLDAFVSNFQGYGNWKARLWFVGMEEGCGGQNELRSRFAAWDARGRADLEDLRDFHLEFGADERFRERRPSTQPTWRGLIRIAQASEGRSLDIEAVRTRQQHNWGRSNGNVCLLELLPLPSPNLTTWSYAGNSRLPYLSCRELYEEHCLQPRINALRQRIKWHKPEVVVFYGYKYQSHWNDIGGGCFVNHPSIAMRHRTAGATVFVSMRHSSRGSTASFNAIGKFVARHLR